MTHAVNIDHQDDAVHLSGELSINNVSELLQASEKWFGSDTNALTINLNQVTRCDSAGVALMLEWVRQAKGHDLQLKLTAPSQQMLSIINVCGLDDVLHFT